MDVVTFLTVIGVVIVITHYVNQYRIKVQNRIIGEIEDAAMDLADLIQTSFLIQACPRCHESLMYLTNVSPNGRSIEYKCEHCNKKSRAAAGNEAAHQAIHAYNEILNRIEQFNLKYRKYRSIEVPVVFSTPDSVLPYQQTTREPIPEHIRAEVWRRDKGRCVSCNLQENLQFDHIIPVSKGGATSVQNLQLLCKQCNLSKSAKI